MMATFQSARLFAHMLLAVPAALCAFAPPGASLQSEPRLTAQLSSGLVKIGETVTYRIQVDDARNPRLDDVPNVPGLRLVARGGPSVTSRMSLAGGRRSHSRSVIWTFELRPERLGEFTIPPLLLSIDGRDVATPEKTLTVVEDLQGRELGYIEIIDPPTRIYEGEPFSIELLAGWDSKLGADVNYLNLLLPWWGQLPGTLEIDVGESTAGLKRGSIKLNTRSDVIVVDLGEREVRGRPFRMVRLKRTFIATRPGALRFPVSSFEFGEVQESFFERRKKTYHVRFDAFEIDVLPLPEDGRPFDFSGAVGEIRAIAAPDRREVEAGESIKLTVDWSGLANLEFFEPPDLKRVEGFDDFRVYGATDRMVGGRREVVYDLAPISSEVEELPSVPLVVFDPRLEQYVTVPTRPIPILVHALEGTSGLEAIGGEAGEMLDVRDIKTRPDGGEAGDVHGPSSRLVWGLMLALPILWLGLRTMVRRHGDPDAPAARRRRGARRSLRRELARCKGASEQEAALQRFLAARSGDLPEAWEGREARNEWRALGLPSETLAGELAQLSSDLEERHWAGDDSPLDAGRLTTVAERLITEGF